MNEHNFNDLLRKYLSGDISPDEHVQLREALDSGEFDREMLQQIEQVLQADQHQYKWAESRQQAIFDEVAALLEMERPVGKRRYMRFWWAAAAAIVLLFCTVWLLKPTRKQLPVAIKQEVIQPASTGAILVLADGRRVELDSTGDAVIDQQGVRTKIDSGRLSYMAAGTMSSAPMYNTITTPRGRQFSIVLPDGTRAWLNAASSLRFPISFTGNERSVVVAGEVYFEVAANAAQPFKVSIPDGTVITVLGTSFNVNAYATENITATTLVTGKVKVNTATQSGMLEPGQQAVSSGKDLKIAVVDVSRVLAWKNGAFDFTGMTFKQAMSQLERWYDVEVIYEDNITELPFSGKISNRASLNSLLKILNGTSLKFRMEGRKLFVHKG